MKAKKKKKKPYAKLEVVKIDNAWFSKITYDECVMVGPFRSTGKDAANDIVAVAKATSWLAEEPWRAAAFVPGKDGFQIRPA